MWLQALPPIGQTVAQVAVPLTAVVAAGAVGCRSLLFEPETPEPRPEPQAERRAQGPSPHTQHPAPTPALTVPAKALRVRLPAQRTLPHTPWQVTYSQVTRAVDETTSAVKKSVDDSPLGAAKLKVSRPYAYAKHAPRALFCTHPNTHPFVVHVHVYAHACMSLPQGERRTRVGAQGSDRVGRQLGRAHGGHQVRRVCTVDTPRPEHGWRCGF